MRCGILIFPTWPLLLLAAAATAQPARVSQPGPTGVPTDRRELPMTVIRDQCIQFTDVKRGDRPWDLRDCRVSEFSEFGMVNGQTYYYATYCLIPNYAVDKGVCGDDSFNAPYYQQRGLAIFERRPSTESATLLSSGSAATLEFSSIRRSLRSFKTWLGQSSTFLLPLMEPAMETRASTICAGPAGGSESRRTRGSPTYSSDFLQASRFGKEYGPICIRCERKRDCINVTTQIAVPPAVLPEFNWLSARCDS
jgi:hypothetical protein